MRRLNFSHGQHLEINVHSGKETERRWDERAGDHWRSEERLRDRETEGHVDPADGEKDMNTVRLTIRKCFHIPEDNLLNETVRLQK